MTMRIGVPQVGQRTTRGGGWRGGGGSSLGWAGTIICRMVSVGMAELACIKPKWRTFLKPWGKTCWRNRRSNSMPSRWAVQRRGSREEPSDLLHTEDGRETVGGLRTQER
jgi:hypothetical protein